MWKDANRSVWLLITCDIGIFNRSGFRYRFYSCLIDSKRDRSDWMHMSDCKMICLKIVAHEIIWSWNILMRSIMCLCCILSLVKSVSMTVMIVPVHMIQYEIGGYMYFKVDFESLIFELLYDASMMFLSYIFMFWWLCPGTDLSNSLYLETTLICCLMEIYMNC